MSKKAQEYIKSRQSGLHERVLRMTAIPGLTEDKMEEQKRKQYVMGIRDGLLRQGYVNVATEFGACVRSLGCMVRADPTASGAWIEAWVFAAWTAYTQAGRVTRHDAFVLGVPSDDFRGYIESLDEKEKYLLTGELLLDKPYLADSNNQGIAAWLELHG